MTDDAGRPIKGHAPPASTAAFDAAMDPPRPALALALAVAATTTSMAFIDTTALNVALPALQASLKATGPQLLWVINAYALPLTALLLTAGALSDRHGLKRVYGGGIAVFALASLACGFAPDPATLIAARAAQGIGAAAMIPGSLALITAVYPPQQRGRAIGLWSALTVVTMAIGPVLGGALAQAGLWRGVFFINVPFAAMAIVLLRRVPLTLHETSDTVRPARPQIDWAGAWLAVVFLSALSFAGTEGPQRGWSSSVIVAVCIVSVASLLAFVVVQARRAQPLLPLSLLRRRAIAVAAALTLLLYSAFNAMMLFLPMNLIQVQGYSANQAGLSMLPVMMMVVLLAPVAGWLTDHARSRSALVIGSLLAACGLALLATMGLTTGPGDFVPRVLPACLLLGAGMGLTTTALSTTMMNAVAAPELGRVSGLNSTLARLASIVAAAVLGGVLLAQFQAALPQRAAELPAELTQALLADASRLAETPTPPGADEQQRRIIERAIHASFVDAFTLVAWLSAALALTGGALALALLRRQPTTQPT